MCNLLGFEKKWRKTKISGVCSTDFPWSDLLSFRFSSLFLAFSHLSLISRFLFKISSFGDFKSLCLHPSVHTFQFILFILIFISIFIYSSIIFGWVSSMPIRGPLFFDPCPYFFDPWVFLKSHHWFCEP